MVSVKRLMLSSSSTSWHEMKAAWITPASLMRMIHHWTNTSPPWMNKRLESAVMTTMNSKGTMERTALPKGMRAMAKNATMKAAHTASPQKL